MSLKVVLKLAALLTALTFSVAAIVLLKQGHMNTFWTSLGFPTGDRLNWCSERVHSIYHIPSGSKLLEKEGKWIWQYPDRGEKELDYLRVEKWFARYCQVPFEGESSDAGEKLPPLFEVVFVGEDRLNIFGADHEFSIRNREFSSETLRNGLQELLAFGDEIK